MAKFLNNSMSFQVKGVFRCVLPHGAVLQSRWLNGRSFCWRNGQVWERDQGCRHCGTSTSHQAQSLKGPATPRLCGFRRGHVLSFRVVSGHVTPGHAMPRHVPWYCMLMLTAQRLIEYHRLVWKHMLDTAYCLPSAFYAPSLICPAAYLSFTVLQGGSGIYIYIYIYIYRERERERER